MYFGKKFSIYFNNFDDLTVECVNNIKDIISERRNIGYGNVCFISGGNQKIEKMEEVTNLNEGFQFVLNSDSEENLYKLISTILKEFNRLDFKFSIYELFPGAELSVETEMGIHENVFNEIITKDRDYGYASVGSAIFHFTPGKERVEYIASADIRFRCELQNVNVLLNEILSDFSDKGFDIDVEFI